MLTSSARLLFLLLVLGTAGCSGEDELGPGPELGDVCEGHANEYVTQHDNGLGVTFDDCTASERGEWIDGRCYCHGEGV